MRERRAARRYKLVLPIIAQRIPLRSPSDILYGKSRDISPNGVYFTTDRQLTVGTQLDLSITLPAEVTQGSQVLVDVLAKVVRIQKKRENEFERIGIAGRIERYHIVRVQPGRS